MTNQRTWIAEVTDPTSGKITVITANTEAKLDRRVDEHLAGDFAPPSRSGHIDGRGG